MVKNGEHDRRAKEREGGREGRERGEGERERRERERIAALTSCTERLRISTTLPSTARSTSRVSFGLNFWNVERKSVVKKKKESVSEKIEKMNEVVDQ